MVIDHGRLLYDGALGGLHEVGESERTLVVDLERELPPIELAGARVVKVEGPRQWLAFPATASAAPLVARIAAAVPADRSLGAGTGHRVGDREDVRGPFNRVRYALCWPRERGVLPGLTAAADRRD